jgi:hypothetical protein
VEEGVPSKLCGCETAKECGLYKALHELQRMQAARRADGNATPLMAIDVDVSQRVAMRMGCMASWIDESVF